MFNSGNYFFPGYGMPYGYMGPRGLGLFRNMRLFKNINWGTLFNNTSKAINSRGESIQSIKACIEWVPLLFVAISIKLGSIIW